MDSSGVPAKIVRFNKMCGFGVKTFQIGAKFAVFHLFDSALVIMKSEEFLDPVMKPEMLIKP